MKTVETIKNARFHFYYSNEPIVCSSFSSSKTVNNLAEATSFFDGDTANKFYILANCEFKTYEHKDILKNLFGAKFDWDRKEWYVDTLEKKASAIFHLIEVINSRELEAFEKSISNNVMSAIAQEKRTQRNIQESKKGILKQT